MNIELPEDDKPLIKKKKAKKEPRKWASKLVLAVMLIIFICLGVQSAAEKIASWHQEKFVNPALTTSFLAPAQNRAK